MNSGWNAGLFTSNYPLVQLSGDELFESTVSCSRTDYCDPDWGLNLGYSTEVQPLNHLKGMYSTFFLWEVL